MLPDVSEKWSKWLPYVFMALAALSRWPGLFPPNFSAFYALFFCAGAFFPCNIKWWLPMGTVVVTDIVLNLYYLIVLHYNTFQWFQLVNYGAFGAVLSVWHPLQPALLLPAPALRRHPGGILFYVLTNTAAWLFNPFNNPEYTKDLAGWLIALTKGTGGFPTTIQFFINSLMSGGLFTGLFAGALKLSEAAESAREKEPQKAAEEEPEGDQEPGEAKA